MKGVILLNIKKIIRELYNINQQCKNLTNNKDYILTIDGIAYGITDTSDIGSHMAIVDLSDDLQELLYDNPVLIRGQDFYTFYKEADKNSLDLIICNDGYQLVSSNDKLLVYKCNDISKYIDIKKLYDLYVLYCENIHSKNNLPEDMFEHLSNLNRPYIFIVDTGGTRYRLSITKQLIRGIKKSSDNGVIVVPFNNKYYYVMYVTTNGEVTMIHSYTGLYYNIPY